MNYTLAEWLNLLIRWVHVFASILWVGSTFFFTWLDGRFSEGDDKVWLVHSGGFYLIEKRKLGTEVPPKLRWFKWEAAITGMSGIALLILVYYFGGLMPDARSIWIGVAVLIVGWAVYDGVWMSPLGKSELAATVLVYLLVVGLTYGLCQVMGGRAAYIHIGALFGTIMVTNVWMRILPGQRRMLAAVAAGRLPDYQLAVTAKLRSKHNTFMVLPVVFIMISNHFPVATYGHRYNWLILSGLILAGWAVAQQLRRA